MEDQNMVTSIDDKPTIPEHEGEDGDDGEGELNGSYSVDTTADFQRIFQEKSDFDSWEEFNSLFEEFQKETGSVFTPRSATSIEYANERRIRGKIPDRFVYYSVKLVCQHYGKYSRREAANGESNLGLGCEAMIHLRYKAQALNIVTCNLEHKNHGLPSTGEVIRKVRSLTFNDELDLLMARMVQEHKPFTCWNSEKEWLSLVQDLQAQDPRLSSVTVRVVKKRIRFLVDRYLANSNGKPPSPDDEMGLLLFELAKAKQDAMDNVPRQQPKKRSRGRPRKKEREDTDLEEEDMDELPQDLEETSPQNAGPGSQDKLKNKKPVPTLATISKDILAFMNYMEHKDEEDRKLRQQDIDLRRGELELHRKEFEFQKERLEFDRIERQAHLDLLKAQLEIFAGPKPRPLIHDGKLDPNAITEYTIVLNNDQAFATQ